MQEVAELIERRDLKVATILDINDSLGLSPDEMNHIDGLAATLLTVQTSLICKVRWPALVQELLGDSSAVAVGGCRVVFRVDESGLISDAVCRKEVEL